MDTPYSYDFLMKCLKEVNSDLDKLKPFQFLVALYDVTKAFRNLSSALGLAFSDITSKVEVWRGLFKNWYKDANSIQEILLKEIELNICPLNGENNKSLGHKKKTTYYEYVSGK